ncbi:MAG: HAMP domain-containing histidine kinase [Alphaproteobacteria bacterium]|nr:HAMP domain-containing histidine kinase [Alphaproteobacteria bacterium]
MSHELRTPLNAIIGYLRTIMDARRALDLDDVRRIARSGRHLLALVSDVLDMSKIEAGSLELRTALFSISEMLDEVREVATSLARTNDNRLVWDVGPMTERVTSDGSPLAPDPAEPPVQRAEVHAGGEVRLAAPPWETASLRIDVSDTGPGIDPETLERLFLLFVQGRAHGLRHAGTGLGLAITHRLVSAMAGSIEVQSELGHGSRFTVLLPLRSSSVPPSQHTQRAQRCSSGSGRPPPRGGSGHGPVDAVEEPASVLLPLGAHQARSPRPSGDRPGLACGGSGRARNTSYRHHVGNAKSRYAGSATSPVERRRKRDRWRRYSSPLRRASATSGVEPCAISPGPQAVEHIDGGVERRADRAVLGLAIPTAVFEALAEEAVHDRSDVDAQGGARLDGAPVDAGLSTSPSK